MHSHTSFCADISRGPLLHAHNAPSDKMSRRKTDTFLFARPNHVVVRNSFWRISAWNLQHIINLAKHYKLSFRHFLLQNWCAEEANMCWLSTCTCRVDWLDCISFWLFLHTSMPDFPSTSSSSSRVFTSLLAFLRSTKIHFCRTRRIKPEPHVVLVKKHGMSAWKILEVFVAIIQWHFIKYLGFPCGFELVLMYWVWASKSLWSDCSSTAQGVKLLFEKFLRFFVWFPPGKKSQ